MPSSTLLVPSGLVRNMQNIKDFFQAKPALAENVQFRPLRVGDLGWVTYRQALLYHREYGWD